MTEIRVVELFAGVGGFRLGLEAASELYRVVWANQWEPKMAEQFAFDCYVSHFGKAKSHVCLDIAKAKSMIPNHDLLVGGFPCQDYSILKKNAPGIEGEKGVLWWQIDDVIRKNRPKLILLENVDMLLRSPAKQPGRDFSIILRCLYEKGYAAEWRIINAADYGQGQRRKRTFILAFHNSTRFFCQMATVTSLHGLKGLHRYVMNDGILAKAFPVLSHERHYTDIWLDDIAFTNVGEVLHHATAKYHTAGVMMNGRVYSVDVAPACEPFIPLKAVLEKRLIEKEFFLQEKDLPQWLYAKGPKHEQRTRKDGTTYAFHEGAVPFPEPLDKPSRTLLTSESQVGRTSHVVTDPVSGQLRTLTPRECERLNGFPDDWTNTGMPMKMRYFCMGNAIVVPLIQRIGISLLHSLPLE